jgi:hypothetical protein
MGFAKGSTSYALSILRDGFTLAAAQPFGNERTDSRGY